MKPDPITTNTDARQHPNGDQVVAYMRSLLEPILDPEHIPELTTDHYFVRAGQYVVVLDCPERWKGLLMGSGGRTIGAIRTLASAYARRIGWGVRLEVCIAGR